MNRCMGCMNPRGSEETCLQCGWTEGKLPDSPQHLVPGTILHEKYLVGRVLGQGGFGITYLGWDLQLDMKLAIKEYMPRDFATRNSGEAEVTFFTGNVKTHFVNGMNKFLEEAKILAKYNNHPGIVSVRDFFKENGTAYLVMYYLDGIDLKKYLDQYGGSLSYEQGLAIMLPVMDALATVHKDGILHRDISPDNIYITMKGEVKLLDFGAARHAMNDSNKSLSVILKPGYAPEEQYRSKGNQGPWTDIYGLAATFYRVLTGKVPTESLDRLEEDTLIPPSRLGVTIPPFAEAAIIKALSIRAQDRFQSMESFQQALLGQLNQANQMSHLTHTIPNNQSNQKNHSFTHTNSSNQSYTTPVSNDEERKTTPLYNQNQVNQTSKKKKTGLIIGLISGGVAILLSIVVMVVIWLIPDEKPVKPVPGNVVVNNNEKKNEINNDKKPEVNPSVQVVVPRMYNLTEEEAIAQLQAAGLTVGNVEYEENFIAKKGRVAFQSVIPDEKVSQNSPIDIKISTGIELPVDVNTIYDQQMDIVNQYWDEAASLLQNQQLEEALKKYIQARDMASELFKHNQNEDARFAEGFIANHMAKIKAQLGYPYYALEDSLESVAIIKEINNPANHFYLSEAYGNLAWHQLLNQLPAEAITSSQEAIKLDPENEFNKINLAHALLLTDQFGPAFKQYREVVAKDVDNFGMANVIAEDLVALEKVGYTHPDMKEINEILLGNMAKTDEAGIERTIYYQTYSEIGEDLEGYMSTYYLDSPQYATIKQNYQNFFDSAEIINVHVENYSIDQISEGTAWVTVTKTFTYGDNSEEKVTYELILIAVMGSELEWVIQEVRVQN
ncbi:protein kinase [Bacillus sp. 31A1R]|uniref:non-specific serine/threonine protein kinase n=1 Tax=Robertmurraya mangrovi TaxID=3098077 RepID=A0ABU5J121_9BACI|nr:protein kinase [Bacillus sp. 31A1R]MDZ5473047.1 protein kinase [Bacillus sp. 31A1R]